MRNALVLLTALSWIEDNLTERLQIDDVAAACFSSTSGLQRSFVAVFGYSLKEYVMKRRLSKAARELSDSSISITELALKYQYGSPEAFSRAFVRIFNQTPSQYRKQHRIREIFPALVLDTSEGGKTQMMKVDISELYDLVKKLRGSYMLCADLVGFERLNNTYGYAVGDGILGEAARRIESFLTEQMVVFRVGGDEFLVLTGLSEQSEAKSLAERIMAVNKTSVDIQGQQVPLSIRVAVAEIPEETNLFASLLVHFDAAVVEMRQ